VFRKITVPVTLVFLLLSFLSPSLVAGDEEKNVFDISQTYPSEFYPVYLNLFQPESMPLTGKLLTLFLAEEERGFTFEPLGENKFSLISANTIREGSTFALKSWGEKGFSFFCDLIFQHYISFSTQVTVDVELKQEKDHIKTETVVRYTLPRFLEGANKFLSFFTGQNFIENKITEFIQELYGLTSNLKNLTPQKWEEMAQDPDVLEKTIFPISFTEEETEKITSILKIVAGE